MKRSDSRISSKDFVQVAPGVPSIAKSRASVVERYFSNNPGLLPINKQPWYAGFVKDMLARGHTDKEIDEMLYPKRSPVVEFRND
jgi:hypothetical protein